MRKHKTLYTDPGLKWEMVGKLVEKYGTETEKIAWSLCRGEAAEWRLGIGTTSVEEIKNSLKARITKGRNAWWKTRNHY